MRNRALPKLVCAWALAVYISLISCQTENILAKEQAKTNEEQTQDYHSNALHRLDFRIEGKSCAVCLLSIQNRVKVLPGVIKVAIMLKSPYGASIIYDSSKVTEQTILDTIKHNESKIKLPQLLDQSISKMPAVLIPPHNKLTMPLPELPQAKSSG